MSLLLLAAIVTAYAQEGTDAHGAFPAAVDGDVRDPMLLARPGRMNRGEAYGSVLAEGIGKPLVLVTSVDGVTTREAALDNVIAANLMGGYAVHDLVRLDLLMPVFVASQSLGEPQGARPGDLRASAMVHLVRPPEHSLDDVAFGLGLVPWLTFPTGDASAFLGQPGVAGGAQLTATLEAGRFVTTGLIGPRFTPDVGLLNVTGADGLDLGAAAGLIASELTGLHLEAKLNSPFVENSEPWRGVPAELMGSVRHRRPSGVALIAGVGGSVTPAIGSPAWRVMVGGGWGQVDDPYADPDGDGIANDQCPREPETVNGYLDDDGCPDRLADLLVSATYKGAEYPEADIALSNGAQAQSFDFGPVRVFGRVPGEAWTATATFACMVGEASTTVVEGDNPLVVPMQPVLDSQVLFTIVDERGEEIDGATLTWVAGPTGCAPEGLTYLAYGKADVLVGAGEHEVAGTAKGFETRLAKFSAAKAGTQEVRIQLSPTRVALEKDEIRILEKVHFETNSHIIKPISYELLAEVAATIVSHPEFGRVEVAGHADERGPDQYNLDLSARRAASVRDFLLKEGVDPEALVVQGYGEQAPLVEGSGEQAWSENRRVQFNILGRAPAKETP